MNPGMKMYMMTRDRQNGDEKERRQPGRNPMETPWEERREPERMEYEHGEPGRREYRNTRSNLAVYNNYQGAESRYRGRDGRWRAGARHSEYEEGAYGNDPMDRRMGEDEDDEEERKKYNVTVQPKNVIQWPYMPGMPHEPPDSRMNPRQIGFGAQNHMGEPHEEGSMEQGMYGMEPLPEFDRETAEEWVRGMHNEDKNHPRGGKWTAEALKPMAQKYNIPTEGKRFWEFYAMVNAMYSNYSEVARKFGITSPEFYVCMAKAFMDDKDAVDDNVAMYYEYIVKK